MPKKPVRNAFYFYMKELEPTLRREGRVLENGIASIVPIAHPRWKVLPEKEKERFEAMAKKEKARLRGVEGDRYRLDNIGNVIADRKDPYAELEKRRMKERKSVRSKWHPAGAEGIIDEKFYFINFQFLCETEEGDFLPAEIGLIEYSLHKGITKKLHRFIEPGKIPTGYRYTCIQHSEDTHLIPVENFDKADCNYIGLWTQIENFLNPKQELPEYPPLYCLGAGNDYKTVENCLDWIHYHTRLGDVSRLTKVYEIEGLLVDLNAHMGNSVSKSICVDLLTATNWDYEPGTRCEYHEEKECKFCALGIVQRYTYAISDQLCATCGVEISEHHMPMRQGLAKVTVLPPSAMAVDPNQEARLSTVGRNVSPVKPPNRKPPPRHMVVKEEDSDSEEEPYTSLRRPNIPAGSMMGVAGAASARGWTKTEPVADPPELDVTTWPSMGRGLSIAASGPDIAPKYAGSVAAPAPNMAPNPPAAWRKPASQSQAGQVVGPPPGIAMPPGFTPLTGQGIGRGMSAMGGAPRPGGLGQMASQPVVPLQMSAPVTNSNSHRDMATPLGSSMLGGRGGGILANVMKGVPKGIPQGRGYAPPGWGAVTQPMQNLKIS